MIITDPVSLQSHLLDIFFFVKNSSTEFHENLTDNLATHTRSQRGSDVVST